MWDDRVNTFALVRSKQEGLNVRLSKLMSERVGLVADPLLMAFTSGAGYNTHSNLGLSTPAEYDAAQQKRQPSRLHDSPKKEPVPQTDQAKLWRRDQPAVVHFRAEQIRRCQRHNPLADLPRVNPCQPSA
jgi:hypothetical protein